MESLQYNLCWRFRPKVGVSGNQSKSNAVVVDIGLVDDDEDDVKVSYGAFFHCLCPLLQFQFYQATRSPISLEHGT